MAFPDLLKLPSIVHYRRFFESNYCKSPTITFDGIPVYFKKKDFDHCCKESVNFKDDTFSPVRIERLSWIKYALQDPKADLRVGWNKKTKNCDNSRRVAIIVKNYLVIIRISAKVNKGQFITAYVADKSIDKILTSEKWTKK